MNKAQLIESIAADTDLPKSSVAKVLDSLTSQVSRALKKGDAVTLIGFGTFSVGKRAARTGRNPRTGAAIQIKAAKTPKFKAGKALKDAVS